jgi:hypothetical protein
MPETAVYSKAEPPDIQTAMRIGQRPVADTMPRLYLCGECRARRIAEGQGICAQCKTMLEEAAGQTGWNAVEWGVIATAITLLAVAVFLIFGVVK